MNLTGVVQQLRKERDRAQSEVERLDAALASLESLDGVGTASRKKRLFSAASRARMAAAQRARWARERGAKPVRLKGPVPIRAKRRLSAAGLAGIRAAQKARWAKWKAKQRKKAA
jgi:hypothetical protein